MLVVQVKVWSSALQRKFLDGHAVWRGGSWAQEGAVILFYGLVHAAPLRLVVGRVGRRLKN